MKSFSLIALPVFFAVITMQAQPYSHYLDYSTQWNETESWGLVSRGSATYRSYIDGDTLINNTWYFKVSSCISGINTYPGRDTVINGYTLLLDTTVIWDTVTLTGFIREDAQKRFYYMTANNPVEFLLYDFNLTLGSRLPAWSSWCVIDSIDTIYFAGEPRKRFISSGYQTIIEGIGSIRGIIAGHNACGFGYEHSSSAICYRNLCDSIIFQEYPGYACAFCKPQTALCLPQSDFIQSAVSVCANTCIKLSDRTNRQPTAWHWTFTGADIGSYEGQHPPEICFQDTGTFEIRLIAENNYGADTVGKSLHVTVKDCRSCVHIPNAFTPNDDGTNDMFNIIASCPVQNYSMKIFNRWGEKVFETANITEGWDGRYRNKLLPPGVYAWQVYFHSKSNLPAENYSGTVALIR